MENYVFYFMAVLLSLTVCFAFAEEGELIGVVISLKGSAYVKLPKAAEPVKAALNMPIYEGSVVSATDGSQVKILTQSGRMISVEAKNSLPVSDKPDRGPAPIWSSIWRAITSRYKSSLSEENLSSLSATRDIKLELIKNPRNSKLLSVPSEMELKTRKEATSYRVVIGYFEGEDKIWQKSVSSSKVVLKDDLPKVVRERFYLCEVKAFQGQILIGSDTAWFELVSEINANKVKSFVEEIKKVCEGEKLACHLLLGAYYMKEELYYDAERELKSALELSEDEPSIHLLLSEIYKKIGLINQADEEIIKGQALAKSARWDM